ncbi:hypothetical protein Tco_0637759 [Tanacetum coccineum]
MPSANEGAEPRCDYESRLRLYAKKAESLESELKETKQTYNVALTKLIKRVKKLEHKIKTSQARRRAKVVIFDDEEAKEDPSNQGRSLIEELDLDAGISLLQLLQMQLEEDKVLKMFKLTPEEEEKLVLAVLDEREEVAAKVNQAHDIDWSDPAVLRYHTLQNRPFYMAEVRKNMCLYLKNQGGYKMSHFKGMSYEDIRPIFERVWDQNQAFIPMGSKIEKEVMKRSGFDLQQESSKPVEEEIVQQDDVIVEQAVKESYRTAGGRRKKLLARKRAKETLSEESAKKQKLEDDTEKEELQVFLNIVPEEESLDVESLATKQYVLELYRLVKDRFQTASPEGYDLLLWGDLKTLIDPNEEDEI